METAVPDLTRHRGFPQLSGDLDWRPRPVLGLGIPWHPGPVQAAAVRAEHVGQADDEGQAAAALVKRTSLRGYRRREGPGVLDLDAQPLARRYRDPDLDRPAGQARPGMLDRVRDELADAQHGLVDRRAAGQAGGGELACGPGRFGPAGQGAGLRHADHPVRHSAERASATTCRATAPGGGSWPRSASSPRTYPSGSASPLRSAATAARAAASSSAYRARVRARSVPVDVSLPAPAARVVIAHPGLATAHRPSAARLDLLPLPGRGAAADPVSARWPL